MGVPAPKLPPTNPVFLAIDAAIVGYEVYTAFNNYVAPSKKGAPDINPEPTIPTKKTPAPTKASLKSNLANYATALATASTLANTNLGKAETKSKEAFEKNATAQSVASSSLLENASQSPLLTNQVFIKDSIDKLIEAINTNTLVSATVFGTLDMNMSAIASSLGAISSTLIDISSNYDASLSNTGDVPYINQDDYYKMLAQSGMSGDAINDAINQENLYIQGLKNSGITDYNDIKKYVQDWRTKTVPLEYQSKVGDEVAGLTNKGWHAEYTTQTAVNSAGEMVTTTVPKTTTATTNVAVELPNIEAWAAAALPVANAMSPDLVARNLSASVAIKEAQPADYVARELYARMEKTEFAVQETAIKDLDGNVVATAKPMAIQAIKSATDARLRTDMNNYSEQDSDIEDMFDFIDNINLKELFAFEKKSERLMRLYGEIPPPVTP